MGEIGFEISFDPFNGWIEVAKFYFWEFFMDQVHHLFYPNEITCFRNADLSEIPIRIDIEISPLYHGEIGAAN